MSRGPGVVQRRLKEIIEAEPSRWFRVEELVKLVYPGTKIETSELSSVRRALNGLPVDKELAHLEYGPGRHLRVRAMPSAEELALEAQKKADRTAKAVESSRARLLSGA